MDIIKSLEILDYLITEMKERIYQKRELLGELRAIKKKYVTEEDYKKVEELEGKQRSYEELRDRIVSATLADFEGYLKYESLKKAGAIK
jgi:hypothetical protein